MNSVPEAPVISAEHPFASWFLAASCAGFLVVYAIPLSLFPLRWARWFRWRLPEGDAHLTVYLGRCTGLLATAIILVAAQAVPDPGGHRIVFELIAVACGSMTALHVWGAIRRTQPWTEHLEIALYGAVCAVSTWLWFRLG
ncbi:MAG TPA: hypothetical protein VIW03_02095 [Anaeromyxobacter sp.]